MKGVRVFLYAVFILSTPILLASSMAIPSAGEKETTSSSSLPPSPFQDFPYVKKTVSKQDEKECITLAFASTSECLYVHVTLAPLAAPPGKAKVLTITEWSQYKVSPADQKKLILYALNYVSGASTGLTLYSYNILYNSPLFQSYEAAGFYMVQREKSSFDGKLLVTMISSPTKGLLPARSLSFPPAESSISSLASQTFTPPSYSFYSPLGAPAFSKSKKKQKIPSSATESHVSSLSTSTRPARSSSH